MCGLCGVLGVETHWSDTSGDLVRLRKGGTKVSQRSYQLAIINSILKLKGVSVSDWQGTSYLISDGKGATDIASHVSNIWTIVDKENKNIFDPLDKKFLKELSKMSVKQNETK